MCEEKNSSRAVSFARTEFFRPCPIHKLNACKYYCCDCLKEEALCEDCATKNHKSLGHLVLQVRRTSYRDSIHVDEIKKLDVDLSCIQQIIINNQLAVYLRPIATKKSTSSSCKQNGINIDGSSKCVTCGSTITKMGSKFCSLACKVTPTSSSRRRRTTDDDISSLDPKAVQMVHHVPISYRKRRRKQEIPRRAPFL